MIKVHVWIVSGMNRISLHTIYPHGTGFEPFSVILLSKHGLSVEPTPSLVRAPSRWSTDVNLSVTVGQGRASSSAPGCVCSVQADLLSPRVVPDGQRCQSPLAVLPGDGKKERNSTDPQTARKTWPQTADISSTTATALIMDWPSVRLCPGFWLTRPVNKCQSPQTRLQWHFMVVCSLYTNCKNVGTDPFNLNASALPLIFVYSKIIYFKRKVSETVLFSSAMYILACSATSFKR